MGYDYDGEKFSLSSESKDGDYENNESQEGGEDELSEITQE